MAKSNSLTGFWLPESTPEAGASKREARIRFIVYYSLWKWIIFESSCGSGLLQLLPHSWGCEPPTRCVLRCRWSRGCCPPRCWTAPCLDAAPQRKIIITQSAHIETPEIWATFYRWNKTKVQRRCPMLWWYSTWSLLTRLNSEKIEKHCDSISAVTLKTNITELTLLQRKKFTETLFTFSDDHN